ncbi:MAG: aminotransferase class I/II-fold pyridoxal phosphate-dependent enzyme [Haloarculaceae archaeon]
MLFDPPDVPAFESFDMEARLSFIESANARYTLDPTDSVGTEVSVGPDPGAGDPELTTETVVFGSNNYLGLAQDERVAEAAATAAREVGTSASSSRIVTGDTVAHRELERDLAATKGTERAITFSPGYATNVGIITSPYPNVVFSDEYNHASIVEGVRMSGADVVTYAHASHPPRSNRTHASV